MAVSVTKNARWFRATGLHENHHGSKSRAQKNAEKTLLLEKTPVLGISNQTE